MPRGIPKAGFRRRKRRAASHVALSSAVPRRRSHESVADVEAKLTDRFDALQIMADATGRGQNRALIVSGPAGLGKSYTVEQTMRQLESEGRQVTYIKGYVRPLSLYTLLYESRHDHAVLVFDDADSIFHDDVSMNLLKTACDTTESRVLHWLSRSVDQETDDTGDTVPRSFTFEGSVIFITNYDFDALIDSGTKLAPHFQALVSRSHYLDLAMKTQLDYLVRIRQVVAHGMLRDHGLSARDTQVILQFIETHASRLRELSLRMVVKLAGLYRMHRAGWEKLAMQTCVRSSR
jgi:hypothetical protein